MCRPSSIDLRMQAAAACRGVRTASATAHASLQSGANQHEGCQLHWGLPQIWSALPSSLSCWHESSNNAVISRQHGQILLLVASLISAQLVSLRAHFCDLGLQASMGGQLPRQRQERRNTAAARRTPPAPARAAQPKLAPCCSSSPQHPSTNSAL